MVKRLNENLVVYRAIAARGRKGGPTPDAIVSEYVDTLGFEPRSRAWYREWHRLLERVGSERRKVAP